jgi:hypothetical protein
MRPSLDHIRPASPEEWDAAWRSCPHATFFQSRAWADAWERATRGRITPDARLVHFDDGERALVPLSLERKSFGLRTSVTSLAATYGGWLSTSSVGTDHARVLMNWLLAEFGDLYWKLNPFDENLVGLELPPTEPDDTQVLELEPGFEAIKRTWTKGHRAAATQAFRAGVEVRPAESTSDWEAYFRIYEDSLRRWGANTLVRHPRALFEELRKLDSPDVKLWLAEQGGEPIAGALCFSARQHVVYWHGAVLERALELRPVHALMHAAIKSACEEGDRRWFDFNPSGPLDGVRAFKKGFGARTLACPSVRLQPAWLRLARRVARRISPRA